MKIKDDLTKLELSLIKERHNNVTRFKDLFNDSNEDIFSLPFELNIASVTAGIILNDTKNNILFRLFIKGTTGKDYKDNNYEVFLVDEAFKTSLNKDPAKIIFDLLLNKPLRFQYKDNHIITFKLVNRQHPYVTKRIVKDETLLVINYTLWDYFI